MRAKFAVEFRTRAEVLLAQQVGKYAEKAARLSGWMETYLAEGLSVFSFPASHRRLILTKDGLERVSKELRPRIRVVSIFPNEVSYLRLVSALLMEISEDRETGRHYLTFEGTKETGQLQRTN